MRCMSPSKFLPWMPSNINTCKMNNSPIRNKYKILGILVLTCMLLHVGMKQVPGEISKIIQAKIGDVV